MSEKTEGAESAGLSLRGFFLAGIDLAHNRLQLLATEVAEEKVRLTLAVIAGLAGLFLLGLAVALITVLMVMLYWETHRIELLAGLGALFALLGSGLLALTLRAMRGNAPPFQVTLDELKKDRDAWRAAQDSH